MSVTIRQEQPDDRSAVFHVNARAFGRDEEARLVDALRRSPAFVPELSLVALSEPGRIVGHLLFTRMTIDAGDRVHDALALAPLAVLPDTQRQGVGSALVAHGLAAARRLGHRLVIVVGHPAYYRRFGFAPASASGIRPPFAVPDDAFMALELEAGALRHVGGNAVYPPEFGAV